MNTQKVAADFGNMDAMRLYKNFIKKTIVFFTLTMVVLAIVLVLDSCTNA